VTSSLAVFEAAILVKSTHLLIPKNQGCFSLKFIIDHKCEILGQHAE